MMGEFCVFFDQHRLRVVNEQLAINIARAKNLHASIHAMKSARSGVTAAWDETRGQ